MMYMAENPKLDLASSYDGGGSEEKISTQKNSVSDHIIGDKSDSFVIDMESFCHGGSNYESNPNSRITLQRSLSRKGSQRGDKKIVNPNCINSNSTSIANDRDSFVSNSSSPGGSPEKLTAVAEESTDHSSNTQFHHQISVTSGNITAATESRFGSRRSSFKRSPPLWLLDPKKILMVFATLSSVGTILLIYFTLSISGTNANENALD